MTEFLPWIVGLIFLGVVVYYIWHTLKEPGHKTAPEDRYHQALELWLDGDLKGATEMLHDLVHDHPASMSPQQAVEHRYAWLSARTRVRVGADPGSLRAILRVGIVIHRSRS